MPIYEYRCGRCGTEFERIRPMFQADQCGPCPECGNLEVKRCLSLFASFSHSEGETRSLSGSSGCGSCAATSCATCGKG